MQILLSSDYDSEVLIEDDISPVAIYQELTDRILEIEVSIEDVSEWLATDQSSLKVSESFGETISIIKEGFDTFPMDFALCDSVHNAVDLFNQVVDYPDEMQAIDMDIGDYPYKDNSRMDPYERLRRWVESHPVQWYKMTYDQIAKELNIVPSTVWKHLCECAMSAKYIKSLEEYKQKREGARKQAKRRRNPTIVKIHDWVRRNYNQWQSMTFEEISEQTQTSLSAVYDNLPKVLLAEGFISDMSEYKRTRRECRGWKNKPVCYIIDII